ncbi:DUF3027 domain-containing protein [Actinospica durhamensis]|uniref:DUF3027 domain-containing protein n=1 Tax=Actinospica durhamensis TaxID=1508375 RepID=UPI0027DCAE27|nr:DUF3027 domain-containing protein [Actinospica durhamensis]
MTTATPAKPRTSRTPVLDTACAEAVELALAAAEDVAGIGNVGRHLDTQSDGERVATHFFEARERGYVGWRWAVTVTRASRSKLVTVDETVLVPGDGAIMPPQWLPWSERLQPGDIGVGDLLPTSPDDVRLEPGYTGADEPETTLGKGAEEEVWEQRDSLPFVAFELGLTRPRVLSREGREAAAERWLQGRGPESDMAQAAPATCSTCGFLALMAGSLRQSFGVCANEYSPADGQVVSLGFGCGGHSEAVASPEPRELPEPVLDEFAMDSVDSAELGHS